MPKRKYAHSPSASLKSLVRLDWQIFLGLKSILVSMENCAEEKGGANYSSAIEMIRGWVKPWTHSNPQLHFTPDSGPGTSKISRTKPTFQYSNPTQTHCKRLWAIWPGIRWPFTVPFGDSKITLKNGRSSLQESSGVRRYMRGLLHTFATSSVCRCSPIPVCSLQCERRTRRDWYGKCSYRNLEHPVCTRLEICWCEAHFHGCTMKCAFSRKNLHRYPGVSLLASMSELYFRQSNAWRLARKL